jgi:broad specificity phosphatase PhoE
VCSAKASRPAYRRSIWCSAAACVAIARPPRPRSRRRRHTLDDAGWAEYDHVAVIAAHRPDWSDQTRMKADLAGLPNPRRAFQQEFEQATARWIGGLHNDDYPESWGGFCARVQNALQRLHARLRKSQTALVFTSGGPISAVAQRLLHLPEENTLRVNWTLANAAISKLIYSERALYLSTLNDHAHFEGVRADLITYR